MKPILMRTRFLFSLSILLCLAWIQDRVFSPPRPGYTHSLLHPAPFSTKATGAPGAVDDTAETLEDEAVTTDVLKNDSVPGTPVISIVLQPAHGEVTLEADNRVTYMPAPDFTGTDHYAYRVCNPGNLCASASVTVAVLPVNDAPLAADDVSTTQEDQAVDVDVLANDSDVDGDILFVERVFQPQNGTAAITDDQQVRYVPEVGFHGEETFLYILSDGSLTAEAALRITVSPLEKPVANNDHYRTGSGYALNVPAASGVLANDVAPAGQALTAGLVSEPAHGELELQADGSFSYRPEAGFTGADTFLYTASDGSRVSDPAAVSILVSPDQENVVANNDEYSVGREGNLEIAAPGVLENDTGPGEQSLSAILKAEPNHGALTLRPDGSFFYAPDVDFIGTDFFTYLATDGVQESNTARVDLLVPDVLEPSVSWVSPVLNDERLDVGDDIVHLMVSADDNIAVAYVNFFRWDAINEKFISIATANSAPYKVYINTMNLNPGWNQVFARSFDTSGNGSLRQFIWLYQNRWHIFSPLVAR